MSVVGIHDFSMSDVNAPDAKRTKRALSALINFAKFREERISAYTAQTVLTEELLDRREELQLAVEHVQHRFAKLLAADDAERDEAKLVMAEVELLQNEVQLLNKKQAVLQAELRDAKQTDAALGDKLKQIKHALAQEVNTATLLRAQIVDDPEHVRRHIADVRDQTARERELLQLAEDKCHAQQATLNTLVQIEKDVARAKEAVQQVGAVAARRAAVADDAKLCGDQAKQTEQALRELSNTMQNVQFTIDSSDEKAKRLKEAHAKRREASLEQLRQCRQEKLLWDKDRLSNATKINQQEIAAKQIDKKIAQTTEAHQLELDAMRNKMNELESALHAYHHRLTVSMTADGNI
jgi:kinetochore protein Nuf2